MTAANQTTGRWREPIEGRAGAIVVVGLALSAIGLFLDTQSARSMVQGCGIAVVLLGAILLFTRPIQVLHSERKRIEANPNTFPAIFRMAYAFGLIAFLMPAVLMFLPDVTAFDSDSGQLCLGKPCPTPDQSGVRKGESAAGGEAKPEDAARTGVSRDDDGSHDAWNWEPIAILIGCDYSSSAATDAQNAGVRLPNEHCGALDPQWVVSIGGWVLDCDAAGHCGQPAGSSKPGSLAPGVNGGEQPSSIPPGIDPVPPSQPLQVNMPPPAPAAKPPEESVAALPRAAVHSGSSACPKSHAHPISGGVVVPLYFVFIALLGGSVGLLRKLPEFQYRSDDDYVPAEGEMTKLTPNLARDFVLFQLIQLLTAPVVALVAFAIVEPNSTVSTLLLAFAAGFSSEPFLILVREFTERVADNRAKQVPLGLGAKLVPGRYVRLVSIVGTRAAGSVGKVLKVDGTKNTADLEFADPAGIVTETIPLDQLAVV
jgi:hypothetical protein